VYHFQLNSLKDSDNYISPACTLRTRLPAQCINAFYIILRKNCIHKIAKRDCWFHLVCLCGTTEFPTGQFLMKFDIWVFFENVWRRCKFDQNLTRTMGTSHKDLHTFMIISHFILLRMRDFSDKIVEKKKRISCPTTSLRNSCR
jgi:hypothetical protein